MTFVKHCLHVCLKEFNKRGNAFNQHIKTVEHYKSCFLCCDPYRNMLEECMKDYNVKIAGENQTPKSYEYEEEIKDMRILMRSKKYLCDPSKKSTLKNFDICSHFLFKFKLFLK